MKNVDLTRRAFVGTVASLAGVNLPNLPETTLDIDCNKPVNSAFGSLPEAVQEFIKNLCYYRRTPMMTHWEEIDDPVYEKLGPHLESLSVATEISKIGHALSDTEETQLTQYFARISNAIELALPHENSIIQSQNGSVNLPIKICSRDHFEQLVDSLTISEKDKKIYKLCVIPEKGLDSWGYLPTLDILIGRLSRELGKLLIQCTSKQGLTNLKSEIAFKTKAFELPEELRKHLLTNLNTQIDQQIKIFERQERYQAYQGLVSSDELVERIWKS